MSNKDQGNDAFRAKNFETAIEFYTEAIKETPEDHTIFGNRAAAHHNLRNWDAAMEDAESCISIKPDWGKGYQRKAMAFQAQGKLDEAIQSFAKGNEVDPANKQIEQMLEAAEEEKITKELGARGGNMGGNPFGSMGGMGGMPGMGGPGGNPFSPEALEGLKTNPKVAHHFKDPQFANSFEMCKQNPQMLMQMMQADPRYQEIFAALTGIDLGKMGEEQQLSEKEREARDKLEKEKAVKKAAEDAAAKKEAEENALPPAAKAKLQVKKEALEKKNEGNALYKARKFEEARAAYSAAIDLDPEELIYYTNLGAVYFEEKKYEDCIAACERAIEKAKDGPYDYSKLGKAMARKANAQAAMGNFDESIKTYKQALIEDNTVATQDAMKRIEKTKRETEAKAYLDPVKSEEHKDAGNALFKEGNYPGAIKEFEEGLRRNPVNKGIYSNRCLAYIKLMEPVAALKDAEKCLELDPTFIKAYCRKAQCHNLMKEYHKALAVYDQGLKIEPDNKECIQGKQETMMKVQMQSSASSGHDEDQMRHAMADPEIQQIMQDPRIRQVLQDMQENPAAGQAALRDPDIAARINKLIAAGVLKVA